MFGRQPIRMRMYRPIRHISSSQTSREQERIELNNNLSLESEDSFKDTDIPRPIYEDSKSKENPISFYKSIGMKILDLLGLQLTYKNLEEYIKDLKSKEKNVVFITAYKTYKPFYLDGAGFGKANVFIGLFTDKKGTSDEDINIKYKIKVDEFDILDFEWPDRVFSGLEKKAKEIIIQLESEGLESVLDRGFEWLKMKKK